MLFRSLDRKAAELAKQQQQQSQLAKSSGNATLPKAQAQEDAQALNHQLDAIQQQIAAKRQELDALNK